MRKTLFFAGMMTCLFCSAGNPNGSETYVDPYADLVGYLNPSEGLLYVLPEYKNDALAALGAESVGNGTYEMYAFQPAEGPKVVFTAMSTGMMLSSYSAYEQRAMADTSTLTATLLGEIRDSLGGTIYKVYKNAACGASSMAEVQKCTTSRDNPQMVKEGKSQRVEMFPINKCIKGAGYCVEVQVTVGRRKYYDDENCQILLNETVIRDFSCIK